MSQQSEEFERIAIARELVRRPEIKFLAGVLYQLTTTTLVDKSDIPAIYVTLAYRIITKPHSREILLAAIEAST